MKVNELIEKLSKLPGDMDVEIYAPGEHSPYEHDWFYEPELFVDEGLSTIVLSILQPNYCVELSFLE